VCGENFSNKDPEVDDTTPQKQDGTIEEWAYSSHLMVQWESSSRVQDWFHIYKRCGITTNFEVVSEVTEFHRQVHEQKYPLIHRAAKPMMAVIEGAMNVPGVPSPYCTTYKSDTDGYRCSRLEEFSWVKIHKRRRLLAKQAGDQPAWRMFFYPPQYHAVVDEETGGWEARPYVSSSNVVDYIAAVTTVDNPSPDANPSKSGDPQGRFFLETDEVGEVAEQTTQDRTTAQRIRPNSAHKKRHQLRRRALVDDGSSMMRLAEKQQKRGGSGVRAAVVKMGRKRRTTANRASSSSSSGGRSWSQTRAAASAGSRRAGADHVSDFTCDRVIEDSSCKLYCKDARHSAACEKVGLLGYLSLH